MTSTRDTPLRRTLTVAENGVFALAGMSVVVHDPHPPPPYGMSRRVVSLHLLSEDIDRMVTAGWTSATPPAGAAHLDPHPADHIRFTITDASVDDWVDRRRRVLGEQLTVRRD